MNQESISKMAAALQQVAENKLNEFEIPETIQAAERTAFHGAAAGAHKAGKSHFNFDFMRALIIFTFYLFCFLLSSNF